MVEYVSEYKKIMKNAERHRLFGYHHMAGIAFEGAAYLCLLKGLEQKYLAKAAIESYEEMMKSVQWHLYSNTVDSKYWIFFDLTQAELIVRRFGLEKSKLNRVENQYRQIIELFKRRGRINLVYPKL